MSDEVIYQSITKLDRGILNGQWLVNRRKMQRLALFICIGGWNTQTRQQPDFMKGNISINTMNSIIQQNPEQCGFGFVPKPRIVLFKIRISAVFKFEASIFVSIILI